MVKATAGQTRDTKWLCLLGCGISMLVLAFFALTTVYSADDYWYSTFWDGGIGNYLELMREHYQVFNGRSLVHAAAHLILHFGNWLFCLVCVGVCGLIPWCLTRAKGLEKESAAVLAAVFLISLIAAPRGILNQGMFWISAFCNYMLPMGMLAVLILLFERLGEKKRMYPLVFLMAFLCGATTEQTGFVTVAVAGYYGISSLLHQRKAGFGYWISGVFAALGLWTIFLSPATKKRLNTETASGGAFSLMDALEELNRVVSEDWGGTVLLLLVLALTGMVLWRQTGRKRHMAAPVLGAALLALGRFFGAGYGLVLALLAVQAVCLLLHKERVMGALLTMALAAICVMLPTDSLAPRTTLPYYVALAMTAAVAAGSLYRPEKGKYVAFGLAAGLVIAAVTVVPMLGGYWHNYQIDAQNRASAEKAKQTGRIDYCMDYDMGYTHTKAFTDGYYYSTYLQSLGLEEAEVYFYSEDGQTVYCEGRLAHFPAVEQDGVRLLPLRDIVEYCGGSLVVKTGVIEVRLDERVWQIKAGGFSSRAKVTWTDAEGKHTEELACSVGLSSRCLDERLFTELLGMTIRQEQNALMISASK